MDPGYFFSLSDLASRDFVCLLSLPTQHIQACWQTHSFASPLPARERANLHCARTPSVGKENRTTEHVCWNFVPGDRPRGCRTCCLLAETSGNTIASLHTLDHKQAIPRSQLCLFSWSRTGGGRDFIRCRVRGSVNT